MVQAKDFAVKAEKEIKTAEEETRKSTRKILCLAAIICFVIISIVLLVVFIWT